MINWICLGLVILSYIIGHMAGYKMCKLRIKNLLRKRINYKLMNADELDAYGSILTQVTRV